jgi:hypothetical protein
MNEMLRRFGFTVYAPDDGSGSGSTDDGSGSGGEGGEGSGSTSTDDDAQKALNAREAAGKAKGKRQALQEVADTLGMSLDEAKKFIEERRAADDEALSEADRKLRDAEEKERKANERIAAAARREREAQAIALLAAEGVKFERDDEGNLKGKGARVMKLVVAGLDDNADAVAIGEAIDELKADMPELFGSSGSTTTDDDENLSDDEKARRLRELQLNGGAGSAGSNGSNGSGEQRAPSGDLNSGGSSQRQQGAQSDLERGAQLAAQRNEQHKPFDPFEKL